MEEICNNKKHNEATVQDFGKKEFIKIIFYSPTKEDKRSS